MTEVEKILVTARHALLYASDEARRVIEGNLGQLAQLLAEKDAALKVAEAIANEAQEELVILRNALEEIAEHGGINMLGKTCADVAKHALKGTGEGNE